MMTNMEQLQKVWEAKDLDGVLNMFTEGIEIKYHHLNQTMQGKEALDYVKEQVLDKGTVSSEFRIIYENDEFAVTYERISGKYFGGQVLIVQLWRENKIYSLEVSLVKV